ncbi:hypothetical protein ACU045_01970 [Microbacterium sp. MAHUQ-60]|uniref:hypothetical protein n=1 Tax=unclassified Microbacterium TaxID=2609290 RepID=UPI00361AF634
MADSNPEPGNPDEVTPDGVPDAVGPDAATPDGVPDAVGPDAATPDGVPDAVSPDAVNRDAVVPQLPGLADLPAIPELAEPDLTIPAPEIPDAVIPPSLLAEPVIPPAPGDTSARHGDSRSTWTSESDAPASIRPRARARARLAAAQAAATPVVPEPSLAPEDVVPPESGASSGSYRGLTMVIFGVLLALLVGAIVLIVVLLNGGFAPSADAASIAGFVGAHPLPV